ncbi:MAG: hypothetical protein NHB32_24145 [Fischerella sp. CENA71]|nr:hypothetical protein [Fischerella sp. CENA71]
MWGSGDKGTRGQGGHGDTGTRGHGDTENIFYWFTASSTLSSTLFLPNPQSPIPNPQSPIPDPRSPIPDPQFKYYG